MSKGKSYNRIVFLTTLSVYLGLVLVGGTAPVLAHSALTRNFDIQNEIEVKDDLDNKPDNEEIESFFALGLDKAVADFVADLRRLKRQGKYKSKFKKSLTASCAHSYCSENEAGATFFPLPKGEIAEALAKLHLKIDVSEENNFYKHLYAGFRKDASAGCKEIDLTLTFNQKELNFNLGFPKESAEKASTLAKSLNRAFVIRSGETKGLLTKRIYENTKAKSENKQVFIVTRLPRGSIDSLLTSKQ